MSTANNLAIPNTEGGGTSTGRRKSISTQGSRHHASEKDANKGDEGLGDEWNNNIHVQMWKEPELTQVNPEGKSLSKR